jgi:hypothetical protein
MANGSRSYDKTRPNYRHSHLSDNSSYFAGGNDMGDLIFIKDGYATTIHADGAITITQSDTCDVCLKKVSVVGGRTVRDLAGEIIQWMCAECRA